MSSVRVLNLASFQGNMGDLVNHRYTRKYLSQRFDWRFTNLEIREYYWGKRSWDRLPELANTYDLLMVGPGNFLELWHDTKSGTTLGLSIEQLESIKVPILFYGIGVDAGMGITHYDRARDFFDYIEQADNRLLIVRNDGANRTLREYFQKEATVVADGGFYLKTTKPKYSHWAVQVAGDMPETRYSDGQMLADIGQIVRDGLLADPELFVVFMPHIHKDLWAIDTCLRFIPDEYLRTRVSVAPYNMGDYFQMYHCDLTLAMRFHANVCSLAQKTKTIGINTYPQVKYLYEELGIEGLCNNGDEIRDCLTKDLQQHYQLPSIHAVHDKIETWLRSCA